MNVLKVSWKLDLVTFTFQAGKELNATSLELWISECKTSSDNSCYTPFSKIKKDILPDWKGFRNDEPILLKQFITSNGRVKLPYRHEWYHFAVIVKEKIVAEKISNIKTSCE